MVSIHSLRPIPESLSRLTAGPLHANILDRHGNLLSLTRRNSLNPHPLPLWEIPEKLQRAFVVAEDKRFYEHHGVDWKARASAILDNIKAGRIVRGGSTITEQCIRIVHPRPRTFYSRWLETIEAYRMEQQFPKEEILEFYLNQVPFSHQCRGVSEAAAFYFGRSLDTLSLQEMLSLAVAVRAPSCFNPLMRGDGQQEELNRRIHILAGHMEGMGMIFREESRSMGQVEIGEGGFQTEAPHFVQFLKREFLEELRSQARVLTTLDGSLQAKLSVLLKESLQKLKAKRVTHGAILVLDHQTDEVLAWVNGCDFFSQEEASQIDAILTPRQPGSTLKPFLYALAMERGFTASSVIPDIPFSTAVSHGIHSFKNYSSTCYGPVRLRCALGNSLNIPAVRVIGQTGIASFLDTLHAVGFLSLGQDVSFYGEGLALGNGEVTLLELVRAYSVLARGGVYREPRFFLSSHCHDEGKEVFSPEVCSLIAHILSDPSARMLEFGGSGLLDFPVQTAVKTGTSTDYRDSWAIGFNYRYTVGVWMGNFDYTPMAEVTGSRGPAFLLRAIFNELTRNGETQPLFFSRTLQSRTICALSGELASDCCPETVTEWFRKGFAPLKLCDWHQRQGERIVTKLPIVYNDWVRHENSESDLAIASHIPMDDRDDSDDQRMPGDQETPAHGGIVMGESRHLVQMIQPVPDLHLALDPRIPNLLERFPFIIETTCPIRMVHWFLDGRLVATTGPDVNRYLWSPQRGEHRVQAKVIVKDSEQEFCTPRIACWVK